MSVFTNLNNAPTRSSSPRRTKGVLADLVNAGVVHIAGDFSIRSGQYGDYATFHIVGDDAHVYYGNKPVTRTLKAVEEQGLRADLPAQPVRFVSRSITFDDGRTVDVIDIFFEEA